MDLDKLKTLAEGATPGPWVTHPGLPIDANLATKEYIAAASPDVVLGLIEDVRLQKAAWVHLSQSQDDRFYENKKLRSALAALKIGDCWCNFINGYDTHHTVACVRATDALE